VRIGIDAGRVLHGAGGVATLARELVRALALPDVPHEVVLFDLDEGVTDRAAFEKAIGPLPERFRMASPNRRELEVLDLFHAPGFRMPPPGALRHLFTLHDLTMFSHPQFHTLDNRVRTVVAVAQALARGASISAVSQATRREAVERLRLDPDEISVVPPIISPAFRPSVPGDGEKNRLREMGLEGQYLLFVGSLEPRKNLGRLLDAWESLPVEVQETHRLVAVVPATWRQEAVRKRFDRLVSRGRALLVENAGEEDLAELYRRSRALVFPSLAEGFGLPVAEAMACGTPVVTSNRSSLPEVAGDAALLVDPDDPGAIASAIERILGDEQLHRRLVTAGLERARRFTASAVLPGLLEVYEDLVGR